MFNILPPYNSGNIASWTEAVFVCTYMFCRTAIVITVLILLLALIKYIGNIIINHKKSKKRDESILKYNSSNCDNCKNFNQQKRTVANDEKDISNN